MTAMLDPVRDGVAVARAADSFFATNGEFNLTLDNSAPLRAMRMRWQHHVLEKREKGDEALF